jgi:acetyl-CoA carboxylase biotin carboxyl carrier protein
MDSSESSSSEVFDVERILRLVELMKEHDLSEIDLRHSEQRIRLRRGNEPETRFVAAPQYSPPPLAQSSPQPAAQAASSAGSEKPEADGKNIYVMKSPMVGTFYRKANPTSPDLVKVGDRVEADATVVCIIEAMKVFNEIPAEVSGTVVAILVDNEEPVEFGKPLFKIDTGK